MPAIVTRLNNLPVIHVKYQGSFSVEDVQGVFANPEAQLRPDDGFMYRIIEFDDVESNFAEILEVARFTATNAPGAPFEARYELILVGHDRWTKLYIQIAQLRQFGGRAIPCFLTFEQALDYVRATSAQ